MHLPHNAVALAYTHKDVPVARIHEILSQLRDAPEERVNQVIAGFMERGGPEWKLVMDIVSKDPRDRRDSPENKKINPPNT